MTSAVAEIDAGFAEAIGRRKDRLDLPLIERALEFSESAHRGQKRLSGEQQRFYEVQHGFWLFLTVREKSMVSVSTEFLGVTGDELSGAGWFVHRPTLSRQLPHGETNEVNIMRP